MITEAEWDRVARIAGQVEQVAAQYQSYDHLPFAVDDLKFLLKVVDETRHEVGVFKLMVSMLRPERELQFEVEWLRAQQQVLERDVMVARAATLAVAVAVERHTREAMNANA